MFASLAVGFLAVAGIVLAGWHPLLALPAFSLCGSAALVAFSLASVAAFPRRALRPAAPVVRLHALAEASGT